LKRLNTENFEGVVSQEKGLFVIKFSSPTCGPCQTMAPVFQALADQNPQIPVYEVDTMESPEIAGQFGVRGVPFVAYCENREVLFEKTGVTPLGDLQFVINNINDPYFREHGEFKKPDVRKTWWFEMIIGLIVLTYLVALLSD